MLYEFDRGLSGTEAAKKINDIYSGAISLRQCQEWLFGSDQVTWSLKIDRKVEDQKKWITRHFEAYPKSTFKKLSRILGWSKSSRICIFIQSGKSTEPVFGYLKSAETYGQPYTFDSSLKLSLKKRFSLGTAMSLISSNWTNHKFRIEQVSKCL
jgi:hypothetical protein